MTSEPSKSLQYPPPPEQFRMRSRSTAVYLIQSAGQLLLAYGRRRLECRGLLDQWGSILKEIDMRANPERSIRNTVAVKGVLASVAVRPVNCIQIAHPWLSTLLSL